MLILHMRSSTMIRPKLNKHTERWSANWIPRRRRVINSDKTRSSKHKENEQLEKIKTLRIHGDVVH